MGELIFGWTEYEISDLILKNGWTKLKFGELYICLWTSFDKRMNKICIGWTNYENSWTKIEMSDLIRLMGELYMYLWTSYENRWTKLKWVT